MINNVGVDTRFYYFIVDDYAVSVCSSVKWQISIVLK